MYVVVSKKEIEQAVFRAEKITGKNLSLAVLRAVLLCAHNNTLTLRATNLDVGIEIHIPAQVKTEGETAVPGDTLSTLLTNTPGTKEVTLETVEGSVRVTTEKGEAILKTYTHEDFPTLPTPSKEGGIVLPATDLVRGFKSVWYSASPSSMKPELASILVAQDGEKLLFAATDSFRLAEKKIPVRGLESFDPLLIPLKNVGEIIRNLDVVEGTTRVLIGENQVSFVTEGMHLTTRIIDGVFPDYTQIIPTEFITEATVLKEDLVTTLKVATVFSNKFNQVQFKLNPNKKSFFLETSNSEVGESRVELDAALSGEPLEIGFNHKYIVDSLQSVANDSIALRFSGSGKPLVIQGVGDKSFTYLVMPMNR